MLIAQVNDQSPRDVVGKLKRIFLENPRILNSQYKILKKSAKNIITAALDRTLLKTVQ